jgi:hypothetical protein
VAHLEREIITCSLIPIATLPVGCTEYLNALESEGTIRTSFVKKRGVYLWTNKSNGGLGPNTKIQKIAKNKLNKCSSNIL